MIIDRLINKIYKFKSPICAGLDPRIERLPISLKKKNSEEEAIYVFNKSIMDTISDIIPCVKLQIAFYELYQEKGIKLFFDTAKYAKQKGFFVIADIKRSDIGDVAAYYSKTYLGSPYIDGITVNPYLGEDSVIPFIKDANKYDKLVFVLAKTSNSGASFIQDIETDEGFVYEKIARKVNSLGFPLRGKYGYSNIGIVVGATYPDDLVRLRRNFPHLFFLVPGVGAQGGAIYEKYEGMLINVSRALIYSFEETPLRDPFLSIREKAIKLIYEVTREGAAL